MKTTGVTSLKIFNQTVDNNWPQCQVEISIRTNLLCSLFHLSDHHIGDTHHTLQISQNKCDLCQYIENDLDT